MCCAGLVGLGGLAALSGCKNDDAAVGANTDGSATGLTVSGGTGSTDGATRAGNLLQGVIGGKQL